MINCHFFLNGQTSNLTQWLFLRRPFAILRKLFWIILISVSSFLLFWGKKIATIAYNINGCLSKKLVSLNYLGWLLECLDFEVKIRIFHLKVNLLQRIHTKSPSDGDGFLSQSWKVGDHIHLISSSKWSLFFNCVNRILVRLNPTIRIKWGVLYLWFFKNTNPKGKGRKLEEKIHPKLKPRF